MARLPRFCPAGLPQHIIQRGNNRQICFADTQDFAAYANWLQEYSIKFGVAIHTWVFMTNHVHLLATPETDKSISEMMQALGRRYVQYFNRTYKRSGTLWEGRYKSSVVQTERYLLECYRYIELNPVRANMINDPADYSWSSYRCNALGVESKLCTPHQEYLQLGKTKSDRLYAYRQLFRHHIDKPLTKEISTTLNKGLALGSPQFKKQVEQLYGRRITPAKIGRPKQESQI